MWLALNANESQLALLDVTGTLRFLSWPLQQQDAQTSVEAQAGIKVRPCFALKDKIVSGAKCLLKDVPI